MTRQARPAANVRGEAYRLALEAARQREADGDPEGAGVIRDLAGSIKRIRITIDDDDAAAKVRTIGDVDLSVRTTNILGATSPVTLIGEVLDNAAHPLRSKLTRHSLVELTAIRPLTLAAAARTTEMGES